MPPGFRKIYTPYNGNIVCFIRRHHMIGAIASVLTAILHRKDFDKKGYDIINTNDYSTCMIGLYWILELLVEGFLLTRCLCKKK